MTLLPVIGALVLLALAADVFITVFHPEGHGGLLTRHLSRLLWRFWRAVAPRGSARDGWLALGGPFLALLAPAVWMLLLITGFALIYYPWIEEFLVSPGALRTPWTEALYHSGLAAATLGSGDIIPDRPALRLLTVLEAVSGFALLSAALSYILAIYRENGRKTTLAANLALHRDASRGPRGASSPRGAGGAELADQRDRWLEEVARELMHVIQAHAQYPILHYFRPVDDGGSLALQIGPLVELGSPSELRDRRGDMAPTPGVVLAAHAVDRYLDAANERFVTGREAGGEDGDRQPSVEERYHRLLHYLGYATPGPAATP